MFSRIEGPIQPNPLLAAAIAILWLPLAGFAWVWPLTPVAAASISALVLLMGLRQGAQLGLLSTTDACRSLCIQSRRIHLRCRNQDIIGHLCPGSRIWPHLLLLRIIPEKGRRARYLVLCDQRPFHNVSPDLLRRTCVLLRHAPPIKEEKGDLHG
ncbi:hypothetical protein QQM79_16280 [Marinobacteraceae bacterium S3BR75-40.1]